MNAIGIGSDGVPVGLLAQTYWSRTKDRQRKASRRKRKIEEKETRYWLDTIEKVELSAKEAGIITKRWYQLDRGADFKETLQWMSQTDSYVTVRGSYNRCVADEDEKFLWDLIEKEAVLGEYEFDVAAGPKRKARQAQMEVRASQVEFILKDRWRKTSRNVNLWVTLAIERGTTPEGEKPLRWLLVTNRPVETFEQAQLVIYGYTQRWRVEEFHKTWKSRTKVEQTQIEHVLDVEKWASILAAAAMRIERLKYLSRHLAQAPASVELTADEVEAAILLRKPKNHQLGTEPTIGQVVRWIADIGGYTGKSSGGPQVRSSLGEGSCASI